MELLRAELVAAGKANHFDQLKDVLIGEREPHRCAAGTAGWEMSRPTHPPGLAVKTRFDAHRRT
jgi:hypothetical protein